jgi:hypothetical protein
MSEHLDRDARTYSCRIRPGHSGEGIKESVVCVEIYSFVGETLIDKALSN